MAERISWSQVVLDREYARIELRIGRRRVETKDLKTAATNPILIGRPPRENPRSIALVTKVSRAVLLSNESNVLMRRTASTDPAAPTSYHRMPNVIGTTVVSVLLVKPLKYRTST